MIIQIHLRTGVVIDGKHFNMFEGELLRGKNIDDMINVEGRFQMDTNIGRMYIPWSNIAMIFLPSDQRRAERDQTHS